MEKKTALTLLGVVLVAFVIGLLVRNTSTGYAAFSSSDCDDIFLESGYGMMAYWTLDDADTSGSTAYDVYGSKDCIIHNAQTGYGGVVEESYWFRTYRSDYLEAESGFTLTKPEFSFAAWVKTYTDDLDNRRIFTWYRNGGRYFVLQGTGSKGVDFTNPGGTVAENGWQLNYDVWNHIAVTYDDGDVKIYRNGELTEEGSLPDYQIYNGNFYIGGNSLVSGNHWNGLIDEAALFDRVLSQEEIERMYDNSLNNNQHYCEITDSDGDGVQDSDDNCPNTYNPGQEDTGEITVIESTDIYNPEENDDCIETGYGEICLTRGCTGPVYNRAGDYIRWKCRPCDSPGIWYSSEFGNNDNAWQQMKSNCFGGDLGNVPGRDMCLENKKTLNRYDISWTGWGTGDGGGNSGTGYFSYTRDGLTGEYIHELIGNDYDVIETGYGALTIARGCRGPVYNTEGDYTRWKCNTCSGGGQWYNTEFGNDENAWQQIKNDCLSGDMTNLPGEEMCLENKKTLNTYDITFDSWTKGEGSPAYGRFAYTRGTPDGVGDACQGGDEGDGGAPSGGGGTAAQTIKVSFDEIEDGVLEGLEKGDTLEFEVYNPDTESRESHSARVVSIDYINKIVTIEISSNPITVTLGLGQSKEVDVNGDGINDVFVEFVSIVGRKANIFFKELVPSVEEGEEVISPVVDDEEEERQEPAIETEKSSPILNYLVYLILIVFVIFIFIVLATKKKKVKKEVIKKLSPEELKARKRAAKKAAESRALAQRREARLKTEKRKAREARQRSELRKKSMIRAKRQRAIESKERKIQEFKREALRK